MASSLMESMDERDEKRPKSPTSTLLTAVSRPEPKHVPSRFHRFAVATISFIPVLALFASGILLGIRSLSSSSYGQYGCDPIGNLWIASSDSYFQVKSYAWNTKYTLEITLAFGRFSYSRAKAIDVIWDLAVGRSCQLLCATILYYVFRRTMTLSLETYKLSHNQVLAMQYRTASLSALWYYLTEASRWSPYGTRYFGRFFRSATLVLWTAYVLILPTWLSAMTGYQANTCPMIPWTDGTFLKFTDLDVCAYVIADGDRVGLSTDACAVSGSPLREAVGACKFVLRAQDDAHSSHGPDLTQLTTLSSETLNDPLSGVGGVLVSDQNEQYDATSTFQYAGQTHDLDSPTLEITRDTASNLFGYNGTMLDNEWLTNVGVCQPQKDYKWGFSFLLLGSFMFATWLLSIFLYVTWLDSFRGGGSVETENVFGRLRTALEVAMSIQEQVGDDAMHLSEHELEILLPARGIGMRSRKESQTLELDQLDHAQNHIIAAFESI